ncbi:MFS transporter [Herbaspirillum lusitanum]|uniref:MFS transporter n=1 Tax=Herbaspirillum lusitanum TaxID=213312 RepID=A0ABW9AEB6_9BURK
MSTSSDYAGALAESAHRPLTRSDYNTLSLSALGGTLEFYDFVIYVFFAAVLGKLFFPVDMPEWLRMLQTFGIFAAGYLARPVGGIIIAHYGDVIGRKRMFTLSIFLMAVPTLIIGLLPTYASIGAAAPVLLLVMRMLQGAAIGGEMPGAWVFVAEHVPPNRYAFGVGALTSGITGGILLGSLMGILINTVYDTQEVADFAWRLPFIVGGAFGLVSVYLRRYLEETPVFRELAARRAQAMEMPLKTVLREHRAACLVTAAMTWALSGAIVVVILMTPSYLQTWYKIPAKLAMEANCAGTFMLTIGCLVVGWACDRIGTRAVMLIGWGGLGLSTWWFYGQLPGTTESLIWGYALVGFFVGSIALTPIVSTRAFPPAVRFTGLSFAYNMAYAVFGGLTPVLISLWLKHDVKGPGHYVLALSILGVLMAFVPMSSKGYKAA